MALPAGSVRSPAKSRMRDLCQCGIGASNKIFYRCLMADVGRQQRLTRGLEYGVFKVQMMSVNVYVFSIYDKEYVFTYK